MNLRLFPACIAISILLGAAAPSPARDKQPAAVRTPAESAAWRTTQTDDLYEASFRYIFRHNDSGMGDMADSYYILVPADGGMADPTNEFLARFANVHPTVKKGSLCKTKGAVTSIKGGAAGILFFVENIYWKSDDEVYVDGGYLEDVVNSARVTCLLKQKKGHWNVTKYAERDPHAAASDSPEAKPAAPSAPPPAAPAPSTPVAPPAAQQ